MSFGDGLAKSNASIGSGEIIYISNGTTIVNGEEGNQSCNYYIAPYNDYQVPFNKKVQSNHQYAINKIMNKAASTFVSNAVHMKQTFFTTNNDAHNTKSITVYQDCPNSNMFQKTCQVIATTDTNKYTFQYLKSMAIEKINTPTIQVANVIYETKIKHPKFVVSKNVNKLLTDKVQNYILDKPTAKKVYTRDALDESRLIFKPAFTLVENRVPYNKSSITIIQPITATVEDYKPPNIGSVTFSGGGGLKGFKITAQKFAYFEHYLSFNSNTVTSILGLPSGVIFEKGCLKGSPTVAGQFTITMKFDDSSALSGIFIVTQVPRQL